MKTWKTRFKSCRTGPNPAQIQFLFHKNLTPHDFSIMTRSWFETALVYKPRKICKFLYFIGFSSLERSTVTSSIKVLFVSHYQCRWCYEKWIETNAGGERSVYFSRMAQEIWYCLEYQQCYSYLQASQEMDSCFRRPRWKCDDSQFAIRNYWIRGKYSSSQSTPIILVYQVDLICF